MQVVHCLPVLPLQEGNVAKPNRGHESYRSTLALEQRVGRDCAAVQQLGVVAQIRIDPVEGVDNRSRGIVRRREHLVGGQNVAFLIQDHEIGERTSTFDSNTHASPNASTFAVSNLAGR